MMDQQTFLEIATIVSKLKMYPYFDVASYILMCLIVREDNPPQTAGKDQPIEVLSYLYLQYNLKAALTSNLGHFLPSINELTSSHVCLKDRVYCMNMIRHLHPHVYSVS